MHAGGRLRKHGHVLDTSSIAYTPFRALSKVITLFILSIDDRNDIKFQF